MLKTLKLLLLSLAICFSASAEEQIFTIDNFSKGMNSHISPLLILPNYGTEVLNLRVNDKYGPLAKRKKMVLLVDGGDSSINGLFRYYKSNGLQKTVWATSTYLYYNASGTKTILKSGLTDGEFWQFVTYQDNLIGFNGVDNNIKWDSSTDSTANTDAHRTAGALCADLGAPYAELNTGTDLDASKWYQYKVGYYDGTTYSYSTARSNPILTGDAVYNIYLTDIPIGPAGTTYRYIYRTLGNTTKANAIADTAFYKVATITGNATQVLADTVSDDTADNDAAPKWSTVSAGSNATPPKTEYGIIHRERLFLGNNSTYLSNLYWSDEYNPDYFDPNDYEQIRPDDGDVITFIKEYRGILVIGKENSIQHFYTDLAEAQWHTSAPFSLIGTPSPYSVAVTPKGIFYYSWKGLYTYTGQSSQLISDAVTADIRDVLPSSVGESVGYYYNNEYHFSYTSKESGEAENNRVLVYDIIRDAYVLDYKNINCFVAFNAGTDLGILHSGSSGTDGYIYAHEDAEGILSIRFKSQLDDGTFDDTRTYGTEGEPYLELGWDCTIDGWLTELKTKDSDIDTIDEIITYLPNAIIDRPDTGGTWTSPIYDLNAGAYDKIYWKESLGSSGDITFQIRAGTTRTTCGTATYSTAVSDPSGTDISSLTAARFVQLRANFSTSDIIYTPYLSTVGKYMVKLTFFKTGSTYESAFLSRWDSGWLNFKNNNWKELRRIRVFYEGESGTLNIRYYNQDTQDENFDIDMSIDSDLTEEDTGNEYLMSKDDKVYTYFVPANEEANNPIGRNWRFVISNENTEPFLVSKIEIKYSSESEID